MHTVWYVQVRVLFPEHRIVRSGMIVFLIVMILMPIIARILDRKGFETSAIVTGVIGYEWMGFIFIAFWGSMLMYGLELIRYGITFITPFSFPSFLTKKPVIFLQIAVIIAFIYGSIEAGNVRIERIQIHTPKLPQDKSRLTIVQVSDLHLGLFTRMNKLRYLIETIKTLSPDILVSTGDLVDSSGDHLSEMAVFFHQIHPPYGKYAVTGNHEYYAGLSKSLQFMENSGFRILRGETITINSVINITGIDDIHVTSSTDIKSILSLAQNGLFTLLLMHRPTPDPNTLGLFDLQLSGHTHGGQIFPFHYFVSIPFRYYSGLYELENGSKLYVNRGSGTWGPQVRIFSPPEITVIELIHSIS